MSYTLQYGQIWPYLPTLAAGALLSLQIAFLAFCGGLLIGTAGASVLSFGGRVTKALVRAYVTFFTNTPQLVQIYFLYFALPDAGILLSSYTAVLIGMTLNAGAYLTDIQRAGFESVRGDRDGGGRGARLLARSTSPLRDPAARRARAFSAAIEPIHSHDARHVHGRDLRR